MKHVHIEMSLLTDHDKVHQQPVHHLVVKKKEADLKFSSYLTINDTDIFLYFDKKKKKFQID